MIELDGVDVMTADAQHTLGRTMELYSKQSRFCLIQVHISLSLSLSLYLIDPNMRDLLHCVDSDKKEEA